MSEQHRNGSPPLVCPWWIGFSLANPVRTLIHRPRAILAPFVEPGMTVVEPGPGVGHFTLELARLVGSAGRVVTLDVQQRMLDGLMKRAVRAGVAGNMETRLVQGAHPPVEDLQSKVDFVLVFWMVHEVPDQRSFFRELRATLKPSGKLLLVEPRIHVSRQAFTKTVELAQQTGLKCLPPPAVTFSMSALLVPA